MTKEKRHKVYKEALRLINIGSRSFICLALEKSYDNLFDRTIVCSKVNFPEFFKFKPFKRLRRRDCWFGSRSEGRQQRIKILKECVRLTK